MTKSLFGTCKFWVALDGGGLVKLKMKAGQCFAYREFQETDEGWSSHTRRWRFDGEALMVDWQTDGVDCDGRLMRYGASSCDPIETQAGYLCPDSGVRFPRWIDAGRHGQRDYAAEAMGY